MHRLAVIAVIAGLAAAGAALQPVGDASAAGPIATFSVDIGGMCPDGRAAPRSTLNVLWRSRDGEVKARQTVKADRDGVWWLDCMTADQPVEVGDVLKATVGDRSRSFTVPRLTVEPQRETDRVTGRAPAGSAVYVYVFTFDGFLVDFDHASWRKRTVTADGTGAYAADYAAVDLVGAEQVSVTWRDAAGDRVSRTVIVPYLQFWIGKATLEGAARPGVEASVRLLDDAANERATAQGVPSFSDFGVFGVISPNGRYGLSGAGGLFGRFLDADAEPARVHVGDRIVATDIAADAEWSVPALPVTTDKAGDVVSGTCLPNLGFAVTSRRSNDDLYGYPAAVVIGFADASGRFRADLTSQSDLRSGDFVRVQCKLATGDVVGRKVIVP